MAKRKFVAGMACRQLIDEVIERRVPLTLTNKDGEMWQVHKAYFLHRDGDRLLIAQPVPDSNDGRLEPAAGQVVAVSFKKGYNKCLFVTCIIRSESIRDENDQIVPALSLRMPQQVEKVQRRAYNRAAVPADLDVTVTLTPVNGKGSVVNGWLSNLSAGGMGVLVNEDAGQQLREDQQFLAKFTPLPGQSEIGVQVRLRHTQAADRNNLYLLGLQIMGLEMSEEGRHIVRQIARIVGIYERRQPIGQHSDLRAGR
ncbi:MAG: PilZ domain-containing protein [Sedimentisphaerales bacterium]|nr:PilZ domain-containing protein [Sedimentisphaerales bacterium]